MNLIEKRLVNRLVKRSLNEANSNSLLDAIELLVDAYKNIDTTIKGN